VVGPQDQLDQSQLETALDDAIDSGRLQELTDEVNPDSYLRVMDQDPVLPPPDPTRPPTTAPPTQVGIGQPANETEPNDSGSEDIGQGWSNGAITGFVVAGVGIVALAAGLAYGRRRAEHKKEQDKFQKQASLQGSIINAELLNTELDHDFDDLEKGNGGGGIVGELSDVDENSSCRLSYKMDQVGLENYEDDSLPAPLPTSDPSFIILPFAGNRPQSTKEPSEGDLGASYIVHDDSHNSSSVFGLYDRKASSGSIGAKTPVSYRSAMGLEEGSDEDDDSSDDDSSAYSSSSDNDSSEINEGDTDSQGSSSSSRSSEYDEHGIMKAHAYEARLAEARRSMEARAVEENVVSQVAETDSSSSSEMIAAGRLAAAASTGGASFYGTARDHGVKGKTLQMEKQTVGSPEIEKAVAAVPAEPSEGPNAGVITGGVADAIALGGAAIYAATRSSDDDNDEEHSENIKEDFLADDETQVRDFESSSHQDEPLKAPYVENNIAAIPEEPTSLNVGVVAGVTGATVAISGAAVYADKRNNDDKEADNGGDHRHVTQDDKNPMQPSPSMETESAIDENQQLVTLPGIAVAGSYSLASVHDPAAVGEESYLQLHDHDDWPEDASKSEEIFPPGSCTGSSFEEGAVVGEDSQMIDDPVALGEESQTMENDSYLSTYTSFEIQAMGASSLVGINESVCGSTTIESGSSFMDERPHDQVEESTMLRPPPRSFTPTNEGLSPAPAAVMGTAGAVGVAALIARFNKGAEEEQLSSSNSLASDSFSDSGQESDSSMESSSHTDESTNFDSQLATSGVSVNTGRDIDGRPRPEPAGVDHPYYSTAAAMTSGAALRAGAVYDFEESDVESSTSLFEQSADTEESESGFEPSFTEESLEVPEESGINAQGNDDDIETSAPDISSRSVDSDAAAIQVRALSSDPSPASSVDGKEHAAAKTFIDGDSSLSAEKEGTTEEIISAINSDAAQVSNQTTTPSTHRQEDEVSTGPSTHQQEDEVSTGAVVLGAVAGSAALAGATSYGLGRRDDSSEDDSNSNLLIADNDSSLPNETEGTVEEIASTANDDTAQTSNEATAPSSHQKEDEVSTGAVVLGAVAGSDALAGATSYALDRRDDGSEDISNLQIQDNEISNLQIQDNESFPTEAGVVAQAPDSVASRGPRKALESTVGAGTLKGNDEVSTGAVVLRVAAAGTTLVGAAAYAASKRDEDSEDELNRSGEEGEKGSLGNDRSAVDSTEPSNQALDLSVCQASNEISMDAAVLVAVAGSTTALGAAGILGVRNDAPEGETNENDVVGAKTEEVAGKDVFEGSLEKQGGSEYLTDSEPGLVWNAEDNPPYEVEVLDLSERTQLTSSDIPQSNYESEYSTERTTDDGSESDEDESISIGTDIGVAASRSMSRSTITTSLAGAQSVSRSTIETAGSSSQDISSRSFYARDCESSLPKTAEDSAQSETALASAEAIMASSTVEFEDSSSSESSSEYDSDSPDEYYSSGSTAMSKTDIISSPVGSEEEVVASLTLQGQSGNDPDAIETIAVAMGDRDSAGLETNESGTFAESGLTESGDTFLAMEEAAHTENPNDVVVTKTRFTPISSNSNQETEKAEPHSSSGVVAATIGAGVLGAFAAQYQDDQESESDNSEYSVESSSTSEDSNSSSYTSSSTDTSDTGSGYSSSESNGDDDNEDSTSEISQIDVKPANVSRSKPTMLPEILEENVGEPGLRSQLKPVKSEGAMLRKLDAAASPGPGGRAQLLRARSDALLPVSKREETLQALLTAWDNEYDITTGEEETTTPSEESLLVHYANAGLPSIEEGAQSEEGSSQSLSIGSSILSDEIVTALKSGPLPEDAIRAAMQHDSSSLLNFDYSLRTVVEENSGVDFDESSSGIGSRSSVDNVQLEFERSSVELDKEFEAEIIQALDPIEEQGETTEVVSSRDLSHAGVSSAKTDLPPDLESGRNTYTSSSASESSSEFESETSSDNSDSSSSNDSSSAYDESSSSSSSSRSPAPSSPNSSASLTDRQASSLKDISVLSSLSEQVNDESVDFFTVEERNALVDSKVWAAIAEANRPSSEGVADTAEQAIKQSLMALKIAEKRATSIESSSESPKSSSSVSFSSDYTSSSNDDDSSA
jgi:hypothetical protein